MSRFLDVYLHQQLAGRLSQDEDGVMTFAYDQSWLQNPRAIALSQSLPLRTEAFRRRECRGFFSGTLPEQAQREAIARNLGISPRNDFAMLELIGGECAGAVTFMPAGEVLPKGAHEYRQLGERELAETLRALPRRPLMAGEDGVRLSLAGAQNKIAVYVRDGAIAIPLGNAPSTHILKPALERFEDIVFNEALCMELAKNIGLSTAAAKVGQVDQMDYLLVERFDRHFEISPEGSPIVVRLHQEDFCQAIGIAPENKYQNEGGPSLKQSFDLLRRASSSPVIDLQAMLNAVIFNYLIGNNDAHGKNFSLLYSGETTSNLEIRLAPLYDLVSTVYYPDLAPKMAMKIGGEYHSEKIFPRHFQAFAEETGLSRAIVVRRVAETAIAIIEALPELAGKYPRAAKLSELIRSRCDRAISRFRSVPR